MYKREYGYVEFGCMVRSMKCVWQEQIENKCGYDANKD